MSAFEIDQPSEVYVTKWQTARVPHGCACCGVKIQVGAQYRRDTMIDGGFVDTEVCCFGCAFALEALSKKNGTHPSPSYCREFLRDGVDIARKREQRLERDVLAGIMRRTRGAK